MRQLRGKLYKVPKRKNKSFFICKKMNKKLHKKEKYLLQKRQLWLSFFLSCISITGSPAQVRCPAINNGKIVAYTGK